MEVKKGVVGNQREKEIMKRFSYILLIILLVSILFPLVPQPVNAIGANWLAGYGYRKAITITGTVDGAKANYQMFLYAWYGAGTDSAGNYYCDSNCQTDFDDIRFTTDDGSTQIDYWRENYGASSRGWFWVEIPSIPISPGTVTIYMYYGNSTATTTSSGTNTFVAFDDFEDAVAGIWTTITGVVTYNSNTHSWGTTGTQSMLLDVTALASRTQCSVTNSDSIAIQWRTWKTNAGSWSAIHGDAAAAVLMGVSDLEELQYYVVGWNTLGAAVAHSTWEKVEVSDFRWTPNTYDIWFNDVIRGNDEPAWVTALYNNLFSIGSTGVTDDTWIDNFLVRNWTATAPTFTSWEASEPVVQTKISSYHASNRATLNAVLLDTTGVTQWGFDYGVTTAMPNTVSTGGVSSSSFQLGITGLSEGSVYYYRSKVYKSGAWIYGVTKRFAMSPQPWEYYDTLSDNYTQNIQSSTWQYQTFTVTDASHKISKVDVQLKGVGTLGTGNVYVYVQKGGAGYPDGNNLAYGTMTANLISTVLPTWYSFTLNQEIAVNYGEKYSIVISFPTGTAANYIRWRADTGAPTYAGGSAGFSKDGARTWTDNITNDQMFLTWGETAFEVSGARVYETFIASGDWLITARMRNEYTPYYPADIASNRFYVQLCDNTTVKAQGNLQQWDYNPASIYISAANAAVLQRGYPYRVKVYAINAPNPFMDYQLQTEDWEGTDLKLLDKWCISTAKDMGLYDGIALTAQVTGKGEVLNEKGGVRFSIGIPGLSNMRPNIYQISTIPITGPGGSGKIVYAPAWQTMVGPYVAGILNGLGTMGGISGRMFGGILVAFVFFIMSIAAGVQKGHTTAGIGLAMIGVPIGLLMGFYDVAGYAAILFVFVIIFVWQVVWKGG